MQAGHWRPASHCWELVVPWVLPCSVPHPWWQTLGRTEYLDCDAQLMPSGFSPFDWHSESSCGRSRYSTNLVIVVTSQAFYPHPTSHHIPLSFPPTLKPPTLILSPGFSQLPLSAPTPSLALVRFVFHLPEWNLNLNSYLPAGTLWWPSRVFRTG